MTKTEPVKTDVLIIGGGPSGLATAIQLANKLQQSGLKKRILLVDKGSAIGNHILSGAVIKPSIFKELLTEDEYSTLPFNAQVTQDKTMWLTASKAFALPFHVPYMSNKGYVTASLSQICRQLALIAESKGVEIYSGFSVNEILYKDGKICGAKTIDTGIDHHGNTMENFQPGTEIEAEIVVFAEGTRGTLAKELINRFHLDEGRNCQIYSLGCKELWSVPEGNIKPGEVYHTMGYPLNMKEFGGGFIYGLDDNKVAVGLVVGLDYEDPTFDTHNAFQVWKTTPFVSQILKGGRLLEYGAKTLPEGGFYALPKLYTDHALIVGDSAGFVAMPALKGIHLSVCSGMQAAETIATALELDDFSESTLSKYDALIKNSLIHEEMYPVRNFRQGFSKGLIIGSIHFVAQLLTNGRGFTNRLRTHTDREATKKLSEFKGTFFKDRFKGKLDFDKVLTFDKPTDVYYSGVNHDEQQVPHLKINNKEQFDQLNIKEYGAPCQYFCSSEVYELHTDKNGHQEIRIHAENCMHCKTCDIKSPGDGITWMLPNGGNGPEFQNM